MTGARTVRNVSALTAGSAGTDGRAKMISRNQNRHPLSGRASLGPCSCACGPFGPAFKKKGVVGLDNTLQLFGDGIDPGKEAMPKTLCQRWHRIVIGAAFAERQPTVFVVQAAQGCCRHCSKGLLQDQQRLRCIPRDLPLATAPCAPQYGQVRSSPMPSSAAATGALSAGRPARTSPTFNLRASIDLSISDSQIKGAFRFKMRSFSVFWAK